MQIINYQRVLTLIYILLITLFFSACVKDPKGMEQNGNFNIEYLFEQNGCKMYRFKDGPRYIYWSDCQGKVSYDANSNTGKSSYTESGETLTTK